MCYFFHGTLHTENKIFSDTERVKKFEFKLLLDMLRLPLNKANKKINFYTGIRLFTSVIFHYRHLYNRHLSNDCKVQEFVFHTTKFLTKLNKSCKHNLSLHI